MPFLYASLLLLREGFDEPFHYGYVEELSSHLEIPRVGKTRRSSDVCGSLGLAPESYVVKRNLLFVITFDEYFQASRQRRTDMRRALCNVMPGSEPGNCGLNYEAHQAPLAYALLAIVDCAEGRSPLLERVLILRLLCGVIASLGTAGSLSLSARRMHLDGRAAEALVFVVLSSQMFYATTAHIANDWLAVPLMVLLFDRTVAAWDNSSIKNMILLTVTLSIATRAKRRKRA